MVNTRTAPSSSQSPPPPPPPTLAEIVAQQAQLINLLAQGQLINLLAQGQLNNQQDTFLEPRIVRAPTPTSRVPGRLSSPPPPTHSKLIIGFAPWNLSSV